MIEPEMLCNCVNNSEQSRLDSYLLALTDAWSRGVLAGGPGPWPFVRNLDATQPILRCMIH